MSILCGDLVAHERRGGSVRALARELQVRGAPTPILDPFLGWYPGWTGSAVTGANGDSLNVGAEAVLRYAEQIGARSVSVLTPFEGVPAPHQAVVDALGAFADRAAAIGLRLHLEVIPTSMAPDLIGGGAWSPGLAAPTSGLSLTCSTWGAPGARRRSSRRFPRTASSTSSSATGRPSRASATTSRRPSRPGTSRGKGNSASPNSPAALTPWGRWATSGLKCSPRNSARCPPRTSDASAARRRTCSLSPSADSLSGARSAAHPEPARLQRRSFPAAPRAAHRLARARRGPQWRASAMGQALVVSGMPPDVR